MRGLLLDTHVVLWWMMDPKQISEAARNRISDSDTAVYLSAGAVWEMAIKKASGRLDFPANLDEVLERDSIEVLPITLPHALAVAELPLHHQDPFDRIQVAQARLEDLVLVTRDKKIPLYDVETLKA